MAHTTHIALFKAPSEGSEDAARKALEFVKGSYSEDGVVGVQIQDGNLVQVTIEAKTPRRNALFQSLETSCGEPTDTYDIKLSKSALESNGPATAPVVEVVANSFPSARVTPGFCSEIEADFLRFDALCKTVAKGDLGFAVYGWSVVEQVNEAGEANRTFLIMRGWQSMKDFETLTKHEKFGQEAVPILLGWNAPFKMVSQL